jgi:pimeloyl-ACP methyl ester carboxylesterase
MAGSHRRRAHDPREIRTYQKITFDPEQARKITAPTLLLVGSESSPDVYHPEKVAAALPDARIAVLEGQEHIADLLAPKLVAEALLPFLREGHSGASKEL